MSTILPVPIELYGPESRESEALQVAASPTTYAFPGSALSSSCFIIPAGSKATIQGAYWMLVWTPNAVGCGVELISADPGPTNISRLVEITGKSAVTPLNDGAFVSASALQAIFDATGAGTIGGTPTKTIGHRAKGDGNKGPLIYVSRLILMVSIP